MKHIHCRDLGFDCDKEIEAETVEEVLTQVAEHAENVHHLEVTPELVEQVKPLITDKYSSK